jgi:hypothetical protein
MKDRKLMTPLGGTAKSDNERERIFKAYCELGQIERHHSTLQGSYRTLASTWMLAAFGGMGFVITKQFPVGIPRSILVAAIAFAAAIGLGLLWVLDLLFYQRLLDSAYIEARNLEERHSWLPQPRNNMRAILRGKGLRYVLWFYILTTGVMVLLTGAGVAWFLERTMGRAYCVIAALFFVGVMIPIYWIMRWKTSITPELEKLLEERNKPAGLTGAP